MKYSGVLLVSDDFEKTKKFYKEVLGLNIISDFGENITFTGGISFQTLDMWADFIDCKVEDVKLDAKNTELYFEDNDIDGFVKKAIDHKVEFIHDIKTFPWGQRSVRVYEPNGYVIEVGETLPFVVQRFLKEGLNDEEISKRMGVSVKLVARWGKAKL